MTRLPLVSILINNHNYGPFLRDAIGSALNQTYRNTEVIVVDDGSTDTSREVIASYGSRIIPVLKENGGQASAFNAGFAASKGEWLHFLDSDDLFHPTKVERVAEATAECPLAGVVAHNLEYRIEVEALFDLPPRRIRQRRLVDDRKGVRRGKGKVSAVLPATSGLCVRRDILERVLPMPEEIRLTADGYLRPAMLSLTPALLLPEALARQRIHGRNLYTLDTQDLGEAARLRRATVLATITFHLKKEHPLLARLTWKQYGWILYQLRSCRSHEARAVEAEIRNRYSVMDQRPWCIVYAAGAFTKAFVRSLLRVGATA